MVRSVLAHAPIILNDRTVSTATSTKKATGTAYQGGSIKKDEVNKWLADTASVVLEKCDPNEMWGLLLETKSLTTLRHMRESCGLLPERTVIPNPDPEECKHLQEAGCITYLGTSHGMAQDLKERGPFFQKLTSLGWSQFTLLWLDYCGTLMTGAGRKRQTDVLILFQNNLINKTTFLFSLTFSVRGSWNMFRDQVMQSARRLVSQLAHIYHVPLTLSGSATYSVKSGPIHTLAFVHTDFKHHLTILRPSSKGSSVDFATGCDRRLLLLKIWSLKCKGIQPAWESMISANALKMTPHCEALQISADVFAKGCLEPSNTLLVLDTTDQVVTKRCKYTVPGENIFTVLEDSMNASENPPIPYQEIGNNYIAEITTSYDTIWLTYFARKAYNAKCLRTCHEWGDLHNILSTSLVRTSLAIALPYVSAVEPWEGAAADWLIHGVQSACQQHSKMMLYPVFVSTWVLGTPHMVILFHNSPPDVAVRLQEAERTVRSRPPPTVKRFEFRFDWNTKRTKRPPPHGAKFKIFATEVLKALPEAATESLTIYEPGAFFLVPQLAGAFFTCCDAVEELEAIQSRIPRVSPSQIHSQHVVIMTNEGTVPFTATWLPHIKTWLESTASQYSTKQRHLLIVMEVSHQNLLDDLINSMKTLTATHSVTDSSKCFSLRHTARLWELIKISFVDAASIT
eukprot:TRINITY_DN6966_c2_g1_i3.p1 TRINITY_DN6966_c2_g1~~TRINITY_DN6966_c2_g1_i3.p1  ORF type:complete len:683 (+),score=92.51 TRINITY_DN6966_c2_g1_i3:1000-3048(+)